MPSDAVWIRFAFVVLKKCRIAACEEPPGVSVPVNEADQPV